MEIPAYISPSLCIGRTFDAEKFRVGRDIFPPFIPTNTVDINKYTLRYKAINTSKDVRDLLDVSGELSVLLKTNTLTASGTGHYIRESRTMDGIQELLAVIRCHTVSVMFKSRVFEMLHRSSFCTLPSLLEWKLNNNYEKNRHCSTHELSSGSSLWDFLTTQIENSITGK